MKRVSFAILHTMPRPRSQKAAESEEKVLKALTGLESGYYNTIYQAAKDTGASESTLFRRRGGGKTHAKAQESQQTLSKAQEKVLIGRAVIKPSVLGQAARLGGVN